VWNENGKTCGTQEVNKAIDDTSNIVDEGTLKTVTDTDE